MQIAASLLQSVTAWSASSCLWCHNYSRVNHACTSLITSAWELINRSAHCRVYRLISHSTLIVTEPVQSINIQSLSRGDINEKIFTASVIKQTRKYWHQPARRRDKERRGGIASAPFIFLPQIEFLFLGIWWPEGLILDHYYCGRLNFITKKTNGRK